MSLGHSCPSPSPLTLLGTFSLDERSLFLHRFDSFLHGNHDKYFDFFLACPTELAPFASAVAFGQAFRASMHAHMLRMDGMSTVNFCFEQVPEMAELSPFDRMALVNANGSAAFGLEEAWFLSPNNIAFYIRFIDYRRRCS